MVEPGESPLQCALREIEEEVGVRAIDPIPLAQLRFQDTDGGTHARVCVRARTNARSAAAETAEAIPFWCARGGHPVSNRMWEDDIVWLPHLLEGEPLVGEFLMHARSAGCTSTPTDDVERTASSRPIGPIR